MKKKRLLLLGHAHFRDILVRRINARQIGNWKAEPLEVSLSRAPEVLGKVLHSDALCVIGGWPESSRFLSAIGLLKVVHSDLKLMMYWVGSDVQSAVRQSSWLKAERGQAYVQRFRHFAGAPWLVEELKQAGIRASLYYLPTLGIEIPDRLPGFPDRFRVLAYLPEASPAFYGQEMVERLVVDFPDVEFWIAASGTPPNPQPNARYLGWVADMKSIYPHIHLLVRMTPHDSVAGMVQEALAFGRHVAWTYELQGVNHCSDYQGLYEVVARLKSEHDNGKFAANSAGVEFMKTMHPDYLLEELLKGIEAP